MSVLTGVYCRITAWMSATRILEKELRVGFIEIAAAAAGQPDQDEIGDHQQQERGVDFPASPQRARHDRRPALLAQRTAIGQHAGVAGHEHKHFGGVAEAVIAKRQPGERIIGDVIDEDEPQRQAAAGIQPQVTVIAIDMNGSRRPRQMIGHDLNQPRLTPPRGGHVTDSAAIVCIGKSSAAVPPAAEPIPAPRIVCNDRFFGGLP